MISIPAAEFTRRIEHIRNEMEKRNIEAIAVYGDEYRKENLRYVSNFWPIFERSMCLIPRIADPILVGAPEGERYAGEMMVWQDYRNIKDFACVTVPEEIDYPLSHFSSLKEVIREALNGKGILGIVGMNDMPYQILDNIRNTDATEIVACDNMINELRIVKSNAEIECLKESGRIACTGYKELMELALPGKTELQAAGAGEGAARAAGAEAITFCIFASGKRTNTIIGRPTQKVIQDGDMIMAAMAIQYQGYITTVGYPFIAGKASAEQKRLLEVLFEAVNVQQTYLKDGAISGEMVRQVKKVFRKHGLEDYDIYPPMHGIGLAEAESPYPNENACYPFQTGMCINSDISLFGHPAGSNRIEEGFVILPEGSVSLTPLIRNLCEKNI